MWSKSWVRQSLKLIMLSTIPIHYSLDFNHWSQAKLKYLLWIIFFIVKTGLWYGNRYWETLLKYCEKLDAQFINIRKFGICIMVTPKIARIHSLLIWHVAITILLTLLHVTAVFWKDIQMLFQLLKLLSAVVDSSVSPRMWFWVDVQWVSYTLLLTNDIFHLLNSPNLWQVILTEKKGEPKCLPSLFWKPLEDLAAPFSKMPKQLKTLKVGPF